MQSSENELLGLIKQGLAFLKNYWLVMISFIGIILVINIYGYIVNEPHYYSHIVFHCKGINPVTLIQLGQQLNSDVSKISEEKKFSHLENIALVQATSIDEKTVRFVFSFFKKDSDIKIVQNEVIEYLMSTSFIAKEVKKKQTIIKKRIKNINQELTNIQVFRKKVEGLIDNKQYQSLGAINLYTNDIISLQNSAIALEADYQDINPFEVLTELRPFRFNSHTLVIKIILSIVLGFLLSIAYSIYKRIT